MAELEPGAELAVRRRIAPARGRAALACDGAFEHVLSRHGIDFRPARARAGFSRGHLLDIVIELPGGGGAGEQAAAEELSELLLGEARAADWLGRVSTQAAPRGGALRVVQARPGSENFFPIVELPATFDAAIAGLYAGLPAQPFWAVDGEQRWVLLELDVDAAADYAAQGDLALASTFLPEMLKCFLAGEAFASARFSRHGELFGYLKSRRRTSDPRRALAERRVLEDALDAALVGERSGRVVGGGLGVLYSYVNFAFDALDRAIDVIRSVGTRVGLPDRSWVLFCDSALADDWVPLVAGAPPPPR
jgi:hypothetical protein